MKLMVLLVLGGMGLVVAPAIASTVEECLFAGMDSEEDLLPGQVPPPPNQLDSMDCTPVDYKQTFGPVKDFGPSASVVVPAAVQAAPVAVQVPVAAPQEAAGGIQNTYNDKQLGRIGEMDAMQGQPLNMRYADNLDYLQGYTRGQQMRTTVPQQRGFGW